MPRLPENQIIKIIIKSAEGSYQTGHSFYLADGLHIYILHLKSVKFSRS